MTSPLQGIYLLADSRALFAVDAGRPLVRTMCDALGRDRPSAAYIGAANGDEPAFFSIFEAAMDLAGVEERRMIRADCASDDAAFLRSADIILLAGGDAGRGWRAMRAASMPEILRERYAAGAVLVGISAGAALLGERGWDGDDPEHLDVFDALGLVPWTVDAHDETNAWRRLKRVIAMAGLGARGLGLPAGSGVVCHPDLSLEPIQRSVVEVLATGDDHTETLLTPATRTV